MRRDPPDISPATNGASSHDDGDDGSTLASVILVDRHEDIAGICGRVDTVPTFAVVIHAPDGNRQLATELGIRRLQRHVEETGKVVAIATANVALSGRARQAGVPVARRPEHIRWDSGGHRVVRLAGHSFATPRLGRYVQAAVILAIALVFVVLTLTMAPSGTVIAYPPTETLSKTVTISASTDRTTIDYTNLIVPASTISTTQRMTLALKTTGTASVGVQPAKVAIAVTNPATSDTDVPDGAIVLGGASGVPFAIDKGATIPGGKTVTLQATAMDAGTSGNLPAGSIKSWANDALKGLTVTNPAAAAGGTNENQAAVAPTDINTIKQMAQDIVNSNAARQMLASARPHDAVFFETAQTSVNYADPVTPAGTPADLLLLDVNVTASANAVLQSTLDLLAQHLLVNQGVGELIPGTVSAVETGARQIDTKTNSIRTEIVLKAEFARNITRAKLREAVLGQGVNSARSTLAERYGIQNSDVSVSPGWMPWLPRFGFRVNVELRSRSSDDANASKGASTNAATATPVPPAASATAGP